MDFAQTMKELEALGTEQNRKTYVRHGVPEPMFGVSWANYGALQKRIKKNHVLAVQLWESGNSDARVLATMVADPEAFTAEDLEKWVRSLRSHVIADAFAKLVARSPFAREKAAAWSASKDEWIGRTGWTLVAALAADAELDDGPFAKWIEKIEKGIGKAPNRVREGMNGALIAIGGRGGLLEGPAIDAAKRIGPVVIDHGDTACKTPDAVEYIRKMLARKSAKAAPAGAAKKAAAPKAKAVKNVAAPAKKTAKPAAAKKATTKR